VFCYTCPAARPAPRPVGRVVDEPGADGVRKHVIDRRGEVVLVSDHPRREAFLEQVPAPFMAGVVLPRVDAVEPTKRRRELVRRALDDQVVMRPHQAVGVNAKAEGPRNSAQEGEKEASVNVVPEERQLGNRAGGDVEQAVRKMETWNAGHGAKVRVGPRKSRPRRTSFPLQTRLREPRRVTVTGRG